MMDYLKKYLAVHGQCDLTIQGISMEPVIMSGDTVTVQRCGTYSVGDILVFDYKNEGLLAHRCLKIEDGRYFCKGDNSFRLEDVTDGQIIGKIDLPDDPHHTEDFLNASYVVTRLFRKCKYDREATLRTEEYQKYKKMYLERNNDKE